MIYELAKLMNKSIIEKENPVNFIDEIISIYCKWNHIDKTTLNVVYMNNPEKSMAYDHYSKTIYVYLLYYFSYLERIKSFKKFYYMLMMSIIHELDHVSFYDAKYAKNTLIGSFFLSAVNTEDLIVDDEANFIYSEFHDYFPYERHANMTMLFVMKQVATLLKNKSYVTNIKRNEFDFFFKGYFDDNFPIGILIKASKIAKNGKAMFNYENLLFYDDNEEIMKQNMLQYDINARFKWGMYLQAKEKMELQRKLG